jgi:tetratricopeptide (TPR) repeat protein
MKLLLTYLFIIFSLNAFSQSSNYDLLIKAGLDDYNKGLTQQALANFEKAHSLDSTRVEAYYYTGVTIASICQQTGQSCNGAIEMLSTAINIKPSFRKSYYNRGVCFLRIGYYKEAISDFNSAIKIDASNGEAYANRGVAKINIGQKNEGCKDIDKAISLNANGASELKKKYCP